jgi:hypothetical protein
MTFKDDCQQAEWAARDAAYPFTPSRAQHEAALQPLVSRLLAMPSSESVDYMVASFEVSGLMPLAVSMYKAQRTNQYKPCD